MKPRAKDHFWEAFTGLLLAAVIFCGTIYGIKVVIEFDRATTLARQVEPLVKRVLPN